MLVADHPLNECQQWTGVPPEERFQVIALAPGNLGHEPFVALVSETHERPSLVYTN
jgi:hypothetical protein